MKNNSESSNCSVQAMRFGFLSTVDAPLLPFYLSAALLNGCDDLVVLCDSKNFAGKNRELWNDRTNGAFEAGYLGVTNIYDFTAATIPFHFVDSHNGDQALRLIKHLDIDCLVNAGTPRRLSARLLDSVEHGVVNVHPGLLPNYRGCSCVEWAILQNDKIGNTAHFMDEGYDTGPIIESDWYQFPRKCDYAGIRTLVYQGGCDLLGRVLAKIQRERLRPKDCRKQTPNEGKYWPPISPEEMGQVLELVQHSEYKYQNIEAPSAA